jgi:hypothetical protein
MRSKKTLGVNAALVAVAALMVWFQLRDDTRASVSDHGSAENEPVADTEPLQAPEIDVGLIVRVTGADTRETVVVLAHQANTRIYAERQETDEYVFSDVPAAGTLLIAWAADAELDRVTAVSELIRLEGTESRLSLHLGRVWPLEVELRRDGGDPDDQADVGLRFPDVDLATRWARNVQLITNKPAAWFLKTRDADGLFRLPFIPAATPIRASGTWGRFAGESPDFELNGAKRVVIDLGRLPASRLIRVRDGTGTPVEAELRVTIVSKPHPRLGSSSRTMFASTNADGLLEVPTGDEESLRVNVIDEEWATQKGEFRLAAGEDILDVRVWPSATLRLRVQYDDGQPYLGTVSVTADFPELGPLERTNVVNWYGRLVDEVPPAAPNDPVEKAKNGPQTQFYEVIAFEKVPLGLALTVKTGNSERVGYPDYETTVFALEVPREILIIVPKVIKKNTTSRIRIVGAFPNPSDCTVVIYRVSEAGIWRAGNAFNLDSSRESDPTYPGRYRVRLTGTSAWQSEEFELAAGVIHDVYPELAPPVTVKARILDEAGLPIEGGTLDLATRGGPSFPATSAEGAVGVSDGDGMVELGGQPHGKSIFRLEASGFQPTIVETILGNEPELFLGEFKLEPARGKVHIRLPKVDNAKVIVRADIVDAYSYCRRVSEPTTDDTITFDKLPYGRTFSIAVFIAGQAKAQKIFNHVSPTAEQPIVELDATDLDIGIGK